jgi:hypothetical protein
MAGTLTFWINPMDAVNSKISRVVVVDLVRNPLYLSDKIISDSLGVYSWNKNDTDDNGRWWTGHDSWQRLWGLLGDMPIEGPSCTIGPGRCSIEAIGYQFGGTGHIKVNIAVGDPAVVKTVGWGITNNDPIGDAALLPVPHHGTVYNSCVIDMPTTITPVTVSCEDFY